VLRAEVALRPAGAQLEFDAEKIADLPKHAVFHVTGQLTVRIADEQRGSERNGALYLEAGATERMSSRFATL
jgi:hypothetical protein